MISEEFEATVRSGGCCYAVTVSLMWLPSDPVAVWLEFRDDDGAIVAWRFARSLIAEALRNGGAGIGNVRLRVIHPITLTDEPWMWVTLIAGPRRCVVVMPVAVLARWHTRASRVVPCGAEFVDVDAMLAAGPETVRVLSPRGWRACRSPIRRRRGQRRPGLSGPPPARARLRRPPVVDDGPGDDVGAGA